MTVNIVNIGFKGTYPSTTADKTGYVSDMDNNDIIYFLGTDYGNAAWSNPANGSHLNLTATGVWSGASIVSSLTDTITGSGGITENSNNGLAITFEFLTCKIQPTRIDLASSWNMATSGVNWRVEASNDGSNWVTISPATTVPFTVGGLRIYNFSNLNASTYYSYIKIHLSSSNANATDLYHRELKIYGNLFRTDGEPADFISPITTVEGLPKFIPETTGVQDGDILYYNGGIVTNKRNTLYETERIVMNSTLAISNSHYPNFYILDPNGSTRTVTLPNSPAENQFLRFKNLDPTNAITIDSGGTLTILDTSTLVTDLFWDGTEWTILNFG